MTKTKRVLGLLIFTFLLVLSGLAGWWLRDYLSSPVGIFTITTPKPKPFLQYTLNNLSKANIRAGKFQLDKKIGDKEGFSSYSFKFEFYPEIEGNGRKSTSGLINLPENKDKYPLILMLRGYVDQEIYQTGMGTKRAGEFFAENGFITLALDFLGYADSDENSANIFESRFQTYTTTLSLLESLDQIKSWDKKNIFLWGHSNGGQIALITLEITGQSYPTSLWAPVSKPFPYSILFYTDESEDRGKFIRRQLAAFEKDYDVELYSLENFYDQINAPLQIHQGGRDDAVPKNWSDDLVKILKKVNKEVAYFIYPQADHNLRPDWNRVVTRDLDFFRNHTKESS